jgi:hypothetical protein
MAALPLVDPISQEPAKIESERWISLRRLSFKFGILVPNSRGIQR